MADIPIFEFAWRGRAREVRDASVDDVARLARVTAPHAFLMFDSVRHRSAVVLPDAVFNAIDGGRVSGSASVYESGFIDELGQGQLIAAYDEPASVVVRRAISTAASVVILVDPRGSPTGVFVPGNAASRLRQTLRNRGLDPGIWFRQSSYGPDDEEDSVRFADDGLVAAIEAINRGEVGGFEESFHSENLNMRNPRVGRCPDHGRPHITALPCQQHGTVQSLAGSIEIR